MKTPKFPSLIRHNYRFKRFEFKPRYYDPEKEELEKRKRMIEKEVEREKRMKEDPAFERKIRMRINMEKEWRNRRRTDTRRSNYRIALILAIMVIILLYIKNKLGI